MGFTVSYPDWSPDGQTIAVTHIYGQNSSTIQFQEGGISVIRQTATGWNQAEVVVVPHTVGKNRYTPNFVPDSSFLLYSEATRQASDWDGLVDSYSDPSATVWAVQPNAQATPVLLARANATSVADKLTLADGRSALVAQRISSGMLMNTFPRSAPFEAKQNGHKLFWFTVASQRRPGVRLYTAKTSVVGDAPTQVLLWMFALDADQVLAGQDGSYPGFFLPFQDLTTSNHMAYWTQKYVSDNPPPPPTDDGTGGATGGTTGVASGGAIATGGNGGVGGTSYVGGSGITTSPFAGNGGAGGPPDTSAGGTGAAGGAGGVVDTTPVTPLPTDALAAYVVDKFTSSTGQISLSLRVDNMTADRVDMSTMTLRYWYQDEGLGVGAALEVDFASVGISNAIKDKVHGTVVAASAPAAGADHYLEISFGAATLSAKGDTGHNDQLKFNGRLHNSGYVGTVDLTNDYSYNGGKTGYDTKITLYQNGKLIAGVEPGKG